jgi:DNA polymerase III subunit delta
MSEAKAMIITLTGANSFMLQRESRRIVQEFTNKYTDMGLDRFDGEDVEYDRIRESLQSLPFLAARKLVIIRSGGANKQFAENAEKLIQELPDTTEVLLIEPKLDKRTAYYKLLKKSTEFQEFNELDGHQLAKWLVSYASEQGGSLKLSDANYLIDRVGVNQQLVFSELTKLLLYNAQISRKSIDLLTEKTPQSTIFDLLDAALNGRHKQALVLYGEQRLQKVDPVQIIALLAWQLHVLSLIKTAGQRDANEIARQAKINPYVVRKSMSIAQKLTLPELKKLVTEVRILDVRLKSESIDPDEALQTFLITI